MSGANKGLGYSIWQWLKKVVEWLLLGLLLHLLVAIWAMILGLGAYGFSDEVLALSLLVALASFLGSAPAAYIMWFESSKGGYLEFTYLVVGLFSGVLVTLLGGAFFFVGRLVEFSVQAPEAWVLAAWVSLLSVTLAVLSVLIDAYLGMRADQVARASR